MGEAYPKSRFKFEWKIAEFVSQGKRLEKTEEMNDNMYELISKCWKQDQKERI